MFISLINKNSSDVSDTVRKNIEERLRKVTKAINKINSKREMLMDEADTMEQMVAKFDEFKTSVNGNVTLEIATLRSMLYRDSVKLREDIAKMRPDRLLELKHQLKSQLQSFDNNTAVYGKVDQVMKMIFRKNGRNRKKENAQKTEVSEEKNVPANVAE